MPGSKPPAHPITSAASLAHLYWALLRHSRFCLAYLRLLGTILRTYLLPQFGARARARVALDMDLDHAVPFDDTWLECYLGFVRLWQGSLGWLYMRFGKRALPEMLAFVEGLETLFQEARKVFAVRDSTLASRPGPRPRFLSLLLHAADRNSFCFPSLHVMIVRYNALALAGAVARLAPDADHSPELAFLEERALRIVESIVHVKQHSVSDIPAGLFLLQSLGGAGAVPAVGREGDLRFLEALFLQPGHGENGDRLRAFMARLYHRLHGACDSGRSPHDALVDFLGRYEAEVGDLLGGEASLPSQDA
jgi:hypothetical protein